MPAGRYHIRPPCEQRDRRPRRALALTSRRYNRRVDDLVAYGAVEASLPALPAYVRRGGSCERRARERGSGASEVFGEADGHCGGGFAV